MSNQKWDTSELPMSVWVILSLYCVPDMPKPPEEDIYIFPDEYKFLSRGKRAIMLKPQPYQRLNVETLVVVDRKMMDNHGHENITTYVLTVLNMASQTFITFLFIYLSVCLPTFQFVHPSIHRVRSQHIVLRNWTCSQSAGHNVKLRS